MTDLGFCTLSPTGLVPSEAQALIAGTPTRHQDSDTFLMVASFSPTHDAGGTLHCPSPTSLAHCNHAMQQIRRSMSRSPSKAPLVHVRSHSPAISTTPQTASPLSPTRHTPTTTNLFLLTTPGSPSPLAVPFPPSARVHRPGIRRHGPMQSNTPRTRTSPKSPAKRGLSESLDSGNSASSSPSTTKQQDQPSRRLSPEHSMDQENNSAPSPQDPSDNLTSRFPMSRLEKRRSGSFADFVSMSSPLKRSDGIMNLDKASLGSPAKRRSLHGANFTPDFNIFDHDSSSAQSHYESTSNSEDEEMSNSQTAPMAPPTSPFHSGIPKRSSSLRKSTLQHRQTERQLFNRSARLDHAADSPTISSFRAKVHQRLSLDNHVATPPRDSPFASQGALPNASIHTISQPQFQVPPNPHPLSRTLTQSSSSSSIVDDSPTHEPAHRPEGFRAPPLDFSKSLPVGASRPIPHLTQEISKVSSNGSFSTPESYKFVKPHPAAFMSTGLISKKNRNIEEVQNNHGGGKFIMPDTPCKRPMNIFSSVQKPVPDSAIAKKQARHSFGTPSTPFNPHASGSAPLYGNRASIFGSAYKPELPRRASFASIEGDERLSQSPRQTTRHESQSSVDFEFPPTPTRPGLSSDLEKLHSRRPTSPPPIAQPIFTEPQSAIKAPNSKLNFITASPGSVDEDSDSAMGDSPSGASPSVNLRLKSSQTSASIPSSFTKSRNLRNLNSPTPLSRKSLAVPSPLISPLALRARAKSARLSPASPLNDRFDQTSPRTPQENVLPPDPSGLSISARSGNLLSRVYTEGSSSASVNLPATPTGPKEYFPQFGRRSLAGFNPVDVDSSLTSRFDKVEMIGVGEFSQVYRVTQPAQPSPFQSFYARSNSRSPSQKSVPDQVWAVKKSKQAYVGAGDRKRRLHEVNVLKALDHADHIISFVDSWEEKNHLYIQTEFCEEGSLDSFLAHIGTKGRLDDFRIWKILLELSLGLKHIHDSGYIHLDIKPANVLITFEGVLKIADFGMAAEWPAKADIEGEGDREYIGPEILRGQYDKPADIFALGLIMLEIAGNVELPDNGVSWQKLRNGDMSDVPSLTWSSAESAVFRDSTGNPISPAKSFEGLHTYDSEKEMTEDNSLGFDLRTPEKQAPNKKSSSLSRSGELVEPPAFMIDSTHEDALDVVVRWMISPEPVNRPVVDQILHTVGVHWAELRRRAGATVYEGNWGPADEVLAEDAEMIDV